MVELGYVYRDEGTQLVGVAISRTEHWRGSPTVELEWVASDDSIHTRSMEEGRLTADLRQAVGFGVQR